MAKWVTQAREAGRRIWGVSTAALNALSPFRGLQLIEIGRCPRAYARGYFLSQAFAGFDAVEVVNSLFLQPLAAMNYVGAPGQHNLAVGTPFNGKQATGGVHVHASISMAVND